MLERLRPFDEHERRVVTQAAVIGRTFGIDLLAATLETICAQRLVRRICKDCAEPVEMPPQALIDEGYTPEEAKTVQIMKGKGCATCNKTGYKGRTGLYEVMEVDDEIRELVLVGASAVELKKKAIELLMRFLIIIF